jgi:hypothetical protein
MQSTSNCPVAPRPFHFRSLSNLSVLRSFAFASKVRQPNLSCFLSLHTNRRHPTSSSVQIKLVRNTQRRSNKQALPVQVICSCPLLLSLSLSLLTHSHFVWSKLDTVPLIRTVLQHLLLFALLPRSDSVQVSSVVEVCSARSIAPAHHTHKPTLIRALFAGDL